MRLCACLASTLATAALGRAHEDPGYPVKNPTVSYWQIPPNPDVADHQSAQLPESVDIVILGSGISGTSVAWHLLMDNNATTPPKVAMIEARRACSGATGRNGGHIRPSSYEEYKEAKDFTSREEAAKVTRLRAHHVDALLAAADQLPEAGRRAAEARAVDSLDVFFDEDEFAEAVRQQETLEAELPDVAREWGVLQRDEAVRVSLMPDAVGVLTGTPKVAGAIWPYRFVTHGLKMLLDRFPGRFSLDTHTTAQTVRPLANGTHNFEVVTDRGTIRANHVVYAVNAWTTHFVPGLGGFLNGILLHMSAQLGGADLPKAGHWPPYLNNVSLPTGRAWTLFRGGLDYVVQNPERDEYMFGGGGFLREIPRNQTLRFDDGRAPDPAVAAYLNGALPTYFGPQNWGGERTDFVPPAVGPSAEDIWPGRAKRVWTGVEGATTDALPVVGPLAEALTHRTVARPAAGREWVAAGFNGEGMAYAWLSGKALAAMVAGQDDDGLFDWFPRAFLPTEQRLGNGTALARRGLGRRRHSRVGSVA